MRTKKLVVEYSDARTIAKQNYPEIEPSIFINQAFPAQVEIKFPVIELLPISELILEDVKFERL